MIRGMSERLPAAVVSRREFVAQAGALAAVGMTSFARPAVAAASNRRGLKRSLKFGMIRQGETVLEKLMVARDAGFDGVEFEITVAESSKREILEACAKTGLAVPGTVSGANGRRFSHADPKVRAEGVENYKVALQTTRDLGGTTVLLYPGIVDADNPYDVVYERMQESVRAVIPTAEKTGTKIAFENVWNNFLLSPLEARDFVDSFNHPLVGWYFDVGNVVTFGWPEQWIRILGKRVFKLDIKEYSRTREREEGKRHGFNVELMEGDCNWPAVMQAVDDVGYTGGWGSAEVRGGDAERLRFIADRMQTIFNL
jgi:L-ribulose-5-phosphate 3-epimerase